MQGKINLNLQGKEIGRNGIWREMESVRNGICKEWNLRVKVTFNVNECASCKVFFYTVNVY